MFACFLHEDCHDMTTAIVPPPWKLKGDALILLYNFTPQVLTALGAVSSAMGEFRGGIGALMLVDYVESGVGPYRELLLIPGRFRRDGAKGWSISKILVSTQASIDSGRTNWGIPKEYADFYRTHDGDVQGWSVSIGGEPLLNIRYTPGKVAFRVFTGPFSAPVLQHLDGKTFVSGIKANGVCKLAKLDEFSINPALFPDVSKVEPLGVVRATTFRLTFPIPKVIV
jgi:hypothetical protein